MWWCYGNTDSQVSLSNTISLNKRTRGIAVSVLHIGAHLMTNEFSSCVVWHETFIPTHTFPHEWKIIFFFFCLEMLWEKSNRAIKRSKYLWMILNSLLMWIHWFCHRYVSNFPFDPIHTEALKCSSKGFVTLPRSVGDYLWLAHIFPNQQTFGLEITGQTNEFNELSHTQWMPLAIWTPIKGYGQVSRPFQGVCTQMWQNAVASVSALTSCSKCWGCQW